MVIVEGSLKLCLEGVGNNLTPNETLMDISINEYVEVRDTYEKHTLLSYFMGQVPPEAIIRDSIKEI